jgi:hypothetical protein
MSGKRAEESLVQDELKAVGIDNCTCNLRKRGTKTEEEEEGKREERKREESARAETASLFVPDSDLAFAVGLGAAHNPSEEAE